MAEANTHLEGDVRAMCDGLTAIAGRLSAVKGKLDTSLAQVARVPSPSRMSGIIVGTPVVGFTILGGALGVAQWLKLIPR